MSISDDVACEEILARVQPRVGVARRIGAHALACVPSRAWSLSRARACLEREVVRPVQVAEQPAVVGVALAHDDGGGAKFVSQRRRHLPKRQRGRVEGRRRHAQPAVAQRRAQPQRQRAACVARKRDKLAKKQRKGTRGVRCTRASAFERAHS
eukprot:1107649-Pleurochrysis_carterae.AAC.2